jgi:alpha-ribazole phosphatase
MQLTLVRHTSLEIDPGICYGQSDVPVSKTFEKEAMQVKKQLHDRHFDQVYCSPLSRCEKLAGYCGFRHFVSDKRVIEFDFGHWELKPWSEISGIYAKNWMENYFELPAPGGESLNMMITRMREFLEEIQQKDFSRILVFTHSGPMRVTAYLLGKIRSDDLFTSSIRFGEMQEWKLQKTISLLHK